MLNLLDLLARNEENFIEFDEAAGLLGEKEALVQAMRLHDLGLVDVVNPMWGIDLGEEEFYRRSAISLHGVLI